MFQHLFTKSLTATVNTLESNAALIGWDALRIVLLYIAARIVIVVSRRSIRSFINSKVVRIERRRRATMESLLDNLIKYTVYFVFILIVLYLLHIHVAALLAGAGIAGLAVGFGAQSLIKDLLTGFFILFEDQYGVGDSVKINTFTGTVQTIGLRLTRLQAWTGEIEIIPNGQIQQVTNYSRENSIAVVDIGISYQADIEQAKQIMQTVIEAMRPEFPNMVGDIQVLGVQALQPTSVLLRATAVCLPTTQYGVQRAAQQRIKAAFDEAGIEIPSQQGFIRIPPDQGQRV